MLLERIDFTSMKQGIISSNTNIQMDSMINFDPPFVHIRSKNEGATSASALLNAINVKAIQPTYANTKARVAVILHHVSPNIHCSPKYKLE